MPTAATVSKTVDLTFFTYRFMILLLLLGYRFAGRIGVKARERSTLNSQPVRLAFQPFFEPLRSLGLPPRR